MRMADCRSDDLPERGLLSRVWPSAGDPDVTVKRLQRTLEAILQLLPSTNTTKVADKYNEM